MTAGNILYRARAKAEGLPSGRVSSSDGSIDSALVLPPELGGSGGQGTNPEQLFASSFASCFLESLAHVASRDDQGLSREASVESSVGIGRDAEQFSLEVELRVSLPGVEQEGAQRLLDEAGRVWPFAKLAGDGVRFNVKLA